MFDQYVTRADFLRLRPQVRRSKKRIDLFFRQFRRRIPDGLLRQGVVEIVHPARIRETNFPAGLRNHKSCLLTLSSLSAKMCRRTILVSQERDRWWFYVGAHTLDLAYQRKVT